MHAAWQEQAVELAMETYVEAMGTQMAMLEMLKTREPSMSLPDVAWLLERCREQAREDLRAGYPLLARTTYVRT